MNCRRPRSEKGFSLVEFGLVMIVSGLMIAGALGVYVSYMKKAKLETAYKRLYETNAMLADSWRVDKRYLCPADPSVKPGQSGVGGEAYGEEIANCETINAGECRGGVCAVVGKDAGGGETRVLIGMVPFRSLAEKFNAQQDTLAKAMAEAKDPAMKEELRLALNRAKSANFLAAKDWAFDGWGRQMTYMVSRAWTESMADGASVASDERAMALRTGGSIIVKDAEGNEITPRGAHFAVISHGESGDGAYDLNGVKVGRACGDLGDMEAENCNGDATIVRASVNSLGAGNNKYDDMVAFNVTASNEAWERVACQKAGADEDDPKNDLCLRNRNIRNVVIGAAEPIVAPERLTVGGMVRADKVSLGLATASPPAQTPEFCGAGDKNCFCDKYGNNCISPSVIGGEALPACGPNQVAVSIGSDLEVDSASTSEEDPSKYLQTIGVEDPVTKKPYSAVKKSYTVPKSNAKMNLVCKDITIKSYNFSCPENQIVYGFEAEGQPKCYDPCTAINGTVVTETRSCPEGYSGSMSCQAIYSCEDSSFSNYECSNTCNPDEVAGKCGSANGKNTLTAPTDNLCETGVASAVTGSGPWSWSCAGQYGGASPTCSANKPVNGQCGSANDAIVTSTPSGAAACASGTAGSMAGSNPWTWTCSGTSEGAPAQCASRAPTTVHGQCGASEGGTYGSTPTDLCNKGNASTVTTTSTTYNWTCSGTGTPAGTSASCSANIATTVHGQCGSSHGNNYQNAPSTGLCAVGPASAVTTNATTYTWTCAGSGSPLGSTASCTAGRLLPVNGSCGASNNTCNAGTSASYNAGSCGGNATWTCQGQYGGSNASCSKANAACPINGSCGASNNTCNSGSASGYNAGSCGGSATWTCNGANGGSNASCSNANAACAVNGSCGASNNTCNSGSASGYNAGSCGGSATWTCNGANGGSNASCSKANAACVVNGSCGGGANTCNSGTASGYNAGSCGGSKTWTCVGANGGSNASCSQANGACAVNGSCGGGANTCNSGTASGYNGGSCGGSQTWTCVGANGGSNAGCSIANGPCPINGVCGSAGACSAGSATGDNGASCGTRTWTCAGANGGSNASCSQAMGSCGGGGGGGGCFTGTTEVTLADGSKKAIASLKVGDKVKGHTQTNAVVSNKPFYVRSILYRINGSADAYVTANHPFFTKGGEWKALDEVLARKEHPGIEISKLEVGDILIHEDGSEVELKSFEAEDHGWLIVYNPSMDGDHTYYANELLMHNSYQQKH